MVHFASSPYEYRRRLPHFQKAGRPLFITFRKLGRDPLPAEARSIVLEHCVYPHDKTILLHSAVVMPEHVHLLLTPLNDDRGSIIPLHRVLKGIKGVSARRVNQLLATQGPLWQDESFDHVLRSDESFQAKVDYIRQNPVRRGLVSTPDAYPWLWPAP